MKSASTRRSLKLHSEPQAHQPLVLPERERVTRRSSKNEGFEVRFMTLFDRPTPLADGEAGLKIG